MMALRRAMVSPSNTELPRRQLDPRRGRLGNSAVLGALVAAGKHHHRLQIDERIQLDNGGIGQHFDDRERANRVGSDQSPRRHTQHLDLQQRHCDAITTFRECSWLQAMLTERQHIHI